MENPDWFVAPKQEGVQQGSSEWHAIRAKGIGASEVAILLGESEWSTPIELWKLKTGKSEPFKGNWATERGKEAEPKIRALYEAKYGCKVETPTLTLGPMIASLDGLYNGIVVEFKYPSKPKHEMAVNGDVPECYRSQIQQQMLLAGCKVCHYVSYDGENIAVVEVKENLELQLKIVKVVLNFWYKNVLADVEPEKNELDIKLEKKENARRDKLSKAAAKREDKPTELY